MLVTNNSKKYEKAPSNDYIGVVADVVDLGTVHTAFGDKPKVRIVWVLNAKDSEGNNYRTIQQVVASMNPKSNLFKIVREILGTDPPCPYELDNLIGISRRLIIQTEPDKRTGELFSNIRVVLPLAGQAPLAIPPGFIRAKDRQQNGTGYGQGNSQPAQQSAPVNLGAPATATGAAQPVPTATAAPTPTVGGTASPAF